MLGLVQRVFVRVPLKPQLLHTYIVVVKLQARQAPTSLTMATQLAGDTRLPPISRKKTLLTNEAATPSRSLRLVNEQASSHSLAIFSGRFHLPGCQPFTCLDKYLQLVGQGWNILA